MTCSSAWCARSSRRIPLPMKARRLREEGLSYAVIGKRLKISKGSAFNACKAA